MDKPPHVDCFAQRRTHVGTSKKRARLYPSAHVNSWCALSLDALGWVFTRAKQYGTTYTSNVMNTLLYLAASLVIAFLQALPLSWVAQLGRLGGGVFFWLDGRHRRMAVKNLTLCFGAEKSLPELRAVAHENFRRIGETYCCTVKTAALNDAEIRKVLEFEGAEDFAHKPDGMRLQSHVFATGHFGNFELFARLSAFISGYRCAATYRALRPASLNRLVESLRTVSGNVIFERRSQALALKKAMSDGGVLLTLLSDQSALDHGLRMPFLGHPCFTTPAPAVFALRYGCALFAPICFRTGLGRWRIEMGDQIPTHRAGRRRSVEELTREINNVMEAAIRRDPANWFWVHNRWKTPRNPVPIEPLQPLEPAKT